MGPAHPSGLKNTWRTHSEPVGEKNFGGRRINKIQKCSGSQVVDSWFRNSFLRQAPSACATSKQVLVWHVLAQIAMRHLETERVVVAEIRTRTIGRAIQRIFVLQAHGSMIP